MGTPASLLRRVAPLALIAAAAAFSVPVHADSNRYKVTNLVSDIPAIPAPNHDAKLKNPWGIAFNPTGFVWVADNHAGFSTLYDGAGVPQSLVVKIPSANGTDLGSPTGIVFSGSNDFVVKNAAGTSGPSRFIFASEDGMISGWAPTVALTQAFKGVLNPTASYKGLALAGNGDGFFLYAADFKGHKIDVYDGAFAPVSMPGGFKDPTIPADFGPFNIQNILGNLYVAYAKVDPATGDEVAGAGLGFVDVFDADGNLLKRLARRGTLNAPWGLVLAPTGFGRFSNRLLVGNFGDGTINAFDPHTGEFEGQLRGTDGHVLKIEGLWGLAFGNGVQKQPTDTLFFAAGTNDEEDGTYGRIDVVSGNDNDDNDHHDGD